MHQHLVLTGQRRELGWGLIDRVAILETDKLSLYLSCILRGQENDTYSGQEVTDTLFSGCGVHMVPYFVTKSMSLLDHWTARCENTTVWHAYDLGTYTVQWHLAGRLLRLSTSSAERR